MATASKKVPAASDTAVPAVKKASTKKVVTETTASSSKAVAKTPAEKKPAASKPAKAPSTRKTSAKKNEVTISPEHRYHMIATAAYYLAERRGFAGGYEMQDWITAEAQIDAQIKS